MTHTIICYRQYGTWTATMPFKTKKLAEQHADRYLRVPEKDYIKDITFIPVELPE